MKADLVRFHAFGFFLAALALNASADPSGITMERSGNQLTLRWQAEPGATQLQWATDLGTPASWQLLSGAVPDGGPIWEKHFTIATDRGFFRLAPPALPVAPPNFRLAEIGGHFLLEWDSTSDAAGYVIYVGTTPDVGPGNHLLALPVTLANNIEIDGLVAGQTYFIAIAATNLAGEGPTAMAASGVFGPKGIVAGDAVQSFLLASGETFDVGAEGAVISLYNSGSPAAFPISATADATGHFRVANVPVGNYFVGYAWNGQGGTIPTPIAVPAEGVALSPLVLPIGPQPPPAGSVLLGTLTLLTGDVARIDLEEFALHERGQVRALLASGAERVVNPDARGAWALTDILASEYPLTLVGSYQGMQTSLPVSAPPLELTRTDLQFANPLPTVRRITMSQGGLEVQTITRGIPVTFQVEIDNPSPIPVTPRWIIEFNGQKLLSTAASPTFAFNLPPGPPGPGLGDALDGGLVRVRVIPSQFFATLDLFDVPIADIAGFGCWSGMVTVWHSNTHTLLFDGHPATVTVTHSGALSPSVANTTPTAGGYFEMPLDPVSVPPYLVRVEKPQHMRFLWPFETRLPIEAQFSVALATTYPGSQTPGRALVINHPLLNHQYGAFLSMPYGSLVDNTNTPWLGDVNVQMFTWDVGVRHPLPPGAELREPNLRNGILQIAAVWFDITTINGAPLTPDATATLTLPVHPAFFVPNLPAYHQVEATGYFERWGYGANKEATRTLPGQYTIPLGTSGLFLVGHDNPQIELLIEPDRTLNYPFDVLVGNSIFPVTVQSFHELDIGHLYTPQYQSARLRVLDLRQAPGIRFFDPTASFPPPLSPMVKSVVVDKNIGVNVAAATLPTIATLPVALSLSAAEPKLTSVSPTIAALNSATHFLSRGGVSSAADANDYYTRINAPATLALWRALNGFPSRFGAPLTGVPANDYATAYYYNLGDLGFARAQTMRMRASGTADGLRDVAFAVTNYATLDDAICGRGAVATVCMDYAARTDLGAVNPSRYTRFYVYGSDGLLLKEANLDGAGLKGVPNLCVICHGGKPFTQGGTTNLGARFLPFDLESFTFHPKYGVQHTEFARMNAALNYSSVSGATLDLIKGWYGNPDPNANPLGFNQNYVPTTGGFTWAGNTNLYANMFKTSCRGCHNTRDNIGFVQFDSLSAFQAFAYGNSAAAVTMQMPHAQRTWSIFWGSRCAVKLGATIPDMPTILGNAAGHVYR